MSYINKIQKGSQEYDINDTRLTITSNDIGKYLKVKDDLSLEFAEVSGGGSGGTQNYVELSCPLSDLGEDTIHISITQEQITLLENDNTLFVKLVDSDTADPADPYWLSVKLGDSSGKLFHFITIINGSPAELIGSVSEAGHCLDVYISGQS